MKKISIIILTLVMVLSVVALAACSLSYTVTFDSDGGSAVASQTVESGAKATEPSDPTKDGYTFEGWVDADGNAYSFDSAITMNITLTATWTEVVVTPDPVETFTVSFDSDGGSAVASQTVESGAKATEPSDPTKDGYTFEGWVDASGDAFDFDTAITADTALKAIWAEVVVTPDPVVTFTVTVDGTEQTVVSGEKAVEPTQPTKEGFTFAGWVDADGDAFSFDTAITADTTVKSTFTAVEYTATFMDGETKVGEVKFTVESESITEPTVPTKTGYTSAWASYTLGTADITINAVHTVIEYTVSVDGTEQTVAHGAKAVEPSEPTAEFGYEFAGWFVGDNEFDFDTDTVTSALTIVSKFTVVESISVATVDELFTAADLSIDNITITADMDISEGTVFNSIGIESGETLTIAEDVTFGAYCIKIHEGGTLVVNGSIDITVLQMLVSSETQLVAALAAGANEIVLTDDITLTSTLTIDSSVVIEGCGFELSFGAAAMSIGNDASAVTVVINDVDFVATASMSYAITSTYSSTLTFDGCSFTGSSVTTMLYIFDTVLTVDNCEFVDFNQGISIQSTDSAATAGAERASATITDSTFTNGTYGMFTSNSGQPSWMYVTDCEFDNVAVFVSNLNGNIVITDCKFTVGTNDNSDASIKNADTDGYLVRFYGTNTFVGAVDFSGDYTNDGDFVFEVSTEAQLVAALETGASEIVITNSFDLVLTETLVIDYTVTITGLGDVTVTVTRDESGSFTSSNDNIVVCADDVVISNITFTFNCGGIGIRLGETGDGPTLAKGGVDRTDDNTFDNFTLSNVTINMTQSNAGALYIGRECYTGTINIDGCTFNSGEVIILVTYIADATINITNNTFCNDYDTGMDQYFYCYNNTLLNGDDGTNFTNVTINFTGNTLSGRGVGSKDAWLGTGVENHYGNSTGNYYHEGITFNSSNNTMTVTVDEKAVIDALVSEMYVTEGIEFVV